MPRPAMSTIASTGESWDAFVDGNFKVVGGEGSAIQGPFPLVRFANVGALPASSISEDCIAFVDDEGAYEHVGTGGPWRRLGGHNAETTERVVGEFDGEDYFQIVVKQVGALGTGSVTIAHGITGFDRCVEIGAFAVTAGGTSVHIPYAGSTNDIAMTVDATNINLAIGASWTAGNALQDAWFILRYVK